MNTEWPGVIDASVLHEDYVNHSARLADAARDGRWDAVFRIIDGNGWVSANQWRITGGSWFAPLHQAAWLGAPVDVVTELVRRGAWRTLRNADGDRPSDIAKRQGHAHLLAALSLPEPAAHEARRFAAWNAHLARLIAERTAEVRPARIRHVPTEIIALEPLDELHFPYPGMYGGFTLSVHRGRLMVESWSRVSGGSGQAHVITERGCVLVDEDFV